MRVERLSTFPEGIEPNEYDYLRADPQAKRYPWALTSHDGLWHRRKPGTAWKRHAFSESASGGAVKAICRPETLWGWEIADEPGEHRVCSSCIDHPLTSTNLS